MFFRAPVETLGDDRKLCRVKPIIWMMLICAAVVPLAGCPEPRKLVQIIPWQGSVTRTEAAGKYLLTEVIEGEGDDFRATLYVSDKETCELISANHHMGWYQRSKTVENICLDEMVTPSEWKRLNTLLSISPLAEEIVIAQYPGAAWRLTPKGAGEFAAERLECRQLEPSVHFGEIPPQYIDVLPGGNFDKGRR